MSANQLRILLVPVESLVREHGVVPATLNFVRYTANTPLEELEAAHEHRVDYWKDVNVPESAMRELRSVLTPCESWDESVEMFGEKGENCIEIWKQRDGTIERIVICLDMRAPALHVIGKCISCISELKCMFSDISTGTLFHPNEVDFWKCARASRCSRYLPREGFPNQ